MNIKKHSLRQAMVAKKPSPGLSIITLASETAALINNEKHTASASKLFCKIKKSFYMTAGAIV